MLAPNNRRQGRRGGWKRQGRAGGFTYFGLLIIVVIMGALLVTAGEVWHTAQLREQEKELLFIGNQFRQAINDYYEHTPGKELRYPVRLEDLLKDPRYPSTQRYLRRIYRDPVSGSEQWGVIKGPDGEIYGVHSLSEEEPLKKGNFSLADRDFEGRKKYADWVFMHVPGQRAGSSLQKP
jgi:type II secretory pathway pseudopilin PulG